MIGFWIGISVGFIAGLYCAWDWWIEAYDRQSHKESMIREIPDQVRDDKHTLPLKFNFEDQLIDFHIQHFADYVRTEERKHIIYRQ